MARFLHNTGAVVGVSVSVVIAIIVVLGMWVVWRCRGLRMHCRFNVPTGEPTNPGASPVFDGGGEQRSTPGEGAADHSFTDGTSHSSLLGSTSILPEYAENSPGDPPPAYSAISRTWSRPHDSMLLSSDFHDTRNTSRADHFEDLGKGGSI